MHVVINFFCFCFFPSCASDQVPQPEETRNNNSNNKNLRADGQQLKGQAPPKEATNLPSTCSKYHKPHPDWVITRAGHWTMAQPYPSASRELGPARQQSSGQPTTSNPCCRFRYIAASAAHSRKSEATPAQMDGKQSRPGKRSRCITSLRPPTSPLQHSRQRLA